MKHLAKDIYIKRLDDYNFELLRKSFPKDKEGSMKKVDGKLKVNYSTLGYYSNWQRVWKKLIDLEIVEWVNDDVNACREMIDEASKNLKTFFNDVR